MVFCYAPRTTSIRGGPMPGSTPCEALRLEFIGDVPVARLADTHRVFEHAVDLLTEVIRLTVAEGHPHLLMVGSDIVFAAPTLVDRLRMVRQWAEAADGRLRIAMVVPPSFIDPERFGVVAAGNFGLAAQVFAQEADAIAWLREERAAELRRSAPLPAM